MCQIPLKQSSLSYSIAQCASDSTTKQSQQLYVGALHVTDNTFPVLV
jgi:hypothetical protein